MTERFCKVCRGWHDLEKPWPHNCRKPDDRQRSDLEFPYLSLDTMEPVQSMLDGQFYTSKAALRESYKEHNRVNGTSIVEVGDDSSITDPKPAPKPKRDKNGVRASVEKAFSQVGLGAR